MKSYKIILTVIFAFLMVSCTNWLTLEPEDGVTLDEFWKTKEHVYSAVTGCYCSLQNGPVEKMFLWGEIRGDMVENGIYTNSNYSNIIDGEISAENSVVNWSSLYTVINNCNIVLKFAPGVREIDGTFTEKQLKAYEAEALTIRAMMYFQLVRSFKDVPLSLEAFVSDDQNLYLPKVSGEAILDTLVRDLKIASVNAPVTYGSTSENKNRVTAWTAKTLLADIYLWQEKYSECYTLCQEVIGSGRFSMITVDKSEYPVEDGGVIIDTVYVPNESDAEQMFINSYVIGNSVESIFEIPFTTLKTNPFYSILGPDINFLKPKLEVIDGTIFPEPLYLTASQATDIRGSGCTYRAGVVWKYVGTSRTGAVRTYSNYTAPWIVYKYSDILLMKAEAMCEIGLNTHDESGQDYYEQAIASMNEVRTARNAIETEDYKFVVNDVDGKSLEKTILAERAREFTFEGKRWYDVLRFAKRNDYEGTNIQYLVNLAINSASPQKQQSLIAKYKDPKHNSHYWPIYYREIETNKNLIQNEFYVK
ncbi:MAG: RagB/SusD family nutrient uptake outer membrane protein [Paludibacter sp.]|nr:RagB/SusD family nutrient uptake outer membrane protein [Paludibacter sp.]